MLPKHLFGKQLFSFPRLFLFLVIFLYAFPVFAQQASQGSIGTNLTAQGMLEHIAKQLPAVMRLVTAIAYVMGMYFVFFGILKLKSFGEARTMMSGEQSVGPPLIYLTIGAMLLFLPSAVSLGLNTFWANPTPYAYLQQNDQWLELYKAAFVVIQIFGTIAFIRGLVILSHLAGHSQPGTFAKGLTHIIGGLFCINIYQFVQLVLNTLGIQT